MTAASRLPMTPPPAPPAAPRELTLAARRRSLLEPNVRFWWVAGFVLLGVSLYLLVTNMLIWAQELKIVRHGIAVTATVDAIGEGEVVGRGNMNSDFPVRLSFDFNGNSYSVTGFLEGRTEEISPKQQVPIRIDPDNPEHWTYLTAAPPIIRGVLASLLVLPFALAALLAAWILRRRVLRIWTTGTCALFMVETTSQSALAPSSRVVRCKDVDGRSTLLVRVFVPRRVAELRPGDQLWLIHRPNKPAAALAAMAYA